MSIIRSTSEQPQQRGRRSNQSSTPEDVQVVIASRNAALARRGRSSRHSGDRFQAQMQTQELRNLAQQREVHLAQVAAGLRNEAEGYVNLREQRQLQERVELQDQLEQTLHQDRLRAERELASRTEMLEARAQREIVDRTQRVEDEARQWASSTSAQHQTDLEQIRNQARAAIAEVQRSRDEERKRLEEALAKQLAS